MVLQPSDIKHVSLEVFQIFSKDTPLLTAGSRSVFNTMTIGWGGLGYLWRWPVCTVYVRPSRYTKEFMDRYDTFSVSVLGDEWKEQKALCGTKSGRDMDKLRACGLSVGFGDLETPYILESRLVMICRKLYYQDFDKALFLDDKIALSYPEDDYHRMYVGEVMQVLQAV